MLGSGSKNVVVAAWLSESGFLRRLVVFAGLVGRLSRRLSNNMDMLVRGMRYPQVGRITMDQCLLDVTDLGPWGAQFLGG